MALMLLIMSSLSGKRGEATTKASPATCENQTSMKEDNVMTTVHAQSRGFSMYVGGGGMLPAVQWTQIYCFALT